MTKISSLTALTGAGVDDAADLLPIVDMSEAGSARNKKITIDETRIALGVSSADSPQFTAINLGHASDTTISRVSAGVVAIEGVNIVTTAGGVTFAADIVVPDEVYDATNWDGSLEVPTKNAVRDKIESISAGSGIAVEDEGVSEGTGITTLNFTGAGCSVTVVGAEAEVIVPGGGASALNDLSDVDTTGQVAGDVLTFDGASWLPQALVLGDGWEHLGGAYTAAGIWDFAVDGAVANIDFTGLAGATDIRIVMSAVTKGTTGVPNLYVSVDNGSSWYTSSGDYVFMDTAGVVTNAASMCQGHLTNATAARSCVMEIQNADKLVPIGINTTVAVSHRQFLASGSPINAVRVNPSGGGNFTGGKVYCLVRMPQQSVGGGINVEDEGIAEATGATVLNFTGAGVTATDVGAGQVDIDIPGGGGDLGAFHLQDQRAASTDGGTFTSGAWQPRVLNTEVINTVTGAVHVTSTVTITIASPGVVSWTAHGLVAGTPVIFSTTGALPTGLTAGTVYYVLAPNANDFTVSATSGGAAVNTSGTQSGVHTAKSNQFELAAGTYDIHAIAPAVQVNNHQTRLQNLTDAATTLLGTSAHSRATSTSDGHSDSRVKGRFVIAGTKRFEFQHRCSTTLATAGMGAGASASWGTTVFADVFIKRIA